MDGRSSDEIKVVSTDKCPICNSEMTLYKAKYNDRYVCKNSCYVYFVDQMYICVFGEVLEYIDVDEAEEKIKFWKENDRYLMRILTQ